ncbi:MAG: ABC transporter substrate-binding protein [Desulfobacterales bacterium]|nr:ABC transporter substrate-binding protein [Desulfobacterales bacterium]MBS3754790.1 ABC transporter substrate-binding protein [Desulfobacterales bacterium]
MKKLLCTGLIVLVSWVAAGPAAAANDPETARDLLKSKIDSVLQVLEQKELSDAEKREKVESIVDPVFHYELMAKLSLGPRHWPKLSSEQQEIFSKRFIQRVKASYFDKISMYSGDADAAFTYEPIRTRNGKVHVPLQVRTENNKIDMVYKFYRTGDSWRIYDAEVNGVSIVQSYRSQFNQILAESTVEMLLKDLKSDENLQ